jgi:hypothetical protein
MRAYQSIRANSGRLLVSGLGAALAIIIAVQVSSAIALVDVMPLDGAVNRTLKGDRLPFSPAIHPVRIKRFDENSPRRAPVLDTKLADGCEPLVSTLAHARLGVTAGRCVS